MYSRDEHLAGLERLLGDVVLEGEIARTPRAVVYRVRTVAAEGRPLALKLALQPSDAEELARFRHEVRLLSEARHPNVVQVFDFGVLPGGFPFLTMELLSPEDPAGKLAGRGWEAFYDVAIQAAAGLAHIHRQGVVHMDLKPQNLGFAIGEGGEGTTLKILDFGLAQVASGPLDRRIRGTLAYAAPEVLLQDSYDQRADLYSLGMTLYVLATGVLPSAGDDLAAIRFHLEGELPDPQRYGPDMPAPLATILKRLLRRDPRERYASAGQLLTALAEAAGRPLDGDAVLTGGTVLSSRLVGRDEALGRLRERLAQAASGRGGAVLVEGDEGLGKSRLLREFRLLAAVSGARVARGQGVAERAEPLGPFLAALADLGLEPMTAGSARAPAETVERDRYRLYRAISGALTAAAAEGPPLALVLDDLHLGGRECEELLVDLGSELAASRVLVVASRRPPGEGAPAREEPGAETVVERLAVPPLDRAGTALLVDACLGTAGLPGSFYDWIHEQSNGSPREAQALLRHLVDDGVLQLRNGDWKPSLPALSRWASAPGGVEALGWQRVKALPGPERALLDAAAVTAEPFDLELLAALLEEDPQAVYERVAALVEQGYLERLIEPGGAVWLVAQRRLRQALYGALAGEARAALHRRLGRLLEARQAAGRATAAAVAEHLWRAGERARSLPWLLAAAAEASAVYAHTQAAGLYARAAEASAHAGDAGGEVTALVAHADALAAAGSYGRAVRVYGELLGRTDLEAREDFDASAAVSSEDGAQLFEPWRPEGPRGGRVREHRPEPTRRAKSSRAGDLGARLLLKKGRLHGRLGEHGEALGSYREGLARLAGAPAPELEIDLLHGTAQALRDSGDSDAAFDAARSALAAAAERGLDRQRASLLNTLGTICSGRGDFRRAGRLIRRGLAVAERTGDEALCLTLSNNLGNVLWKTGELEAALEIYSRNLALCERTHDLWGQIHALNNLGILECSRGNWKLARAPLAQSLEVKRRLGAREGEVVARLNLGEVEEVLGQWSRAQRHYERALKLLEDAPDHPERVAAQAQLASLARKRGATPEAERWARAALDGAERIGDRDLAAQCQLQLGLVEKDRDSFPAAAAALERALELAGDTGTRETLARVHVSLADLALRWGDRPTAEAHAGAARRLVGELGDRFAHAKLLVVEARLAMLDDRVEAAERLFGEGIRVFEELETPYEFARSLYEWGLRTSNLDLALERLRRALAAFERLGAETEARRASGAIERIREHQRFGAGRSDATLVYEVVKVINSTLDLEEVLTRTMDLAIERLGAERGMVVLADPLTRELRIAVARNLAAGETAEGRELSESVVRRVIESRQPVLAADAREDSRFAGSESIVARHIVSILCVPLAIRERPAGAIYVDHRRSSHLFGQRDLEFLAAFADHAAIAIENARLYGEIDASRQRLKEENESLKREILASHRLGSLIGKSRVIAELKQTLERVAQSPSTVLIRGESGTGKGLVARIIHAVSPRRQGPFIAFNCAALPETLVESELFGHERGAFTGAAAQKPGRFELAHHGTIFLDEIGKVSRTVQAKLLRVVEDKEFERVGGTRTLRTDCRVVAATNLDLEAAIQRNEFREDLYYRLNIIPIVLPPLRERREDLPYLVQHFLGKISRDLGLPRKELDPAVLDLLWAYDWPGNVRELESAIHRALVLSQGDVLGLADFGWIALRGGRAPAAPEPPGAPRPRLDVGYQEALDRFDRELVGTALAQSNGRIREAARLLGIARNTLKAKMKRLGLDAGRD